MALSLITFPFLALFSAFNIGPKSLLKLKIKKTKMVKIMRWVADQYDVEDRTTAVFAGLDCVEWGCRRELAIFRNSLPEALKWRAEYWLNRLTPQSVATTLQRDPPAGLKQALARIELLEHGDMGMANAGRLTGDNLAVVGRVGSRQSYSRQGVKGDCVAC